MGRIGWLGAVGGCFLLIISLGPRAVGDGLYDFFKRKEKPAQKEGKKEEPRTEEKSLFDFFKREEKSGEGKEHHVVIHHYPYWPYPYDPYFGQYRPRLAPAILPKGAEPPETLGALPPFYPVEASPGTKRAVLRDIVLAWRDKNLDLIRAHIDPDLPIACYLKRRFSHVLSAEEFLRNTRKAFETLDTKSFRLEKIYRSRKAKFYAKGVHIFVDPRGVLHKVPIDYCFVKRRGRWVIRKVSYYGAARGLKCAIASAVFGPEGPEVEALEMLRDRALWPAVAGRALIRTYYWVSPGIAQLIAGCSPLTGLLRTALWPIVWIAQKEGGGLEPCGGPSLSSL